MIKKTMQALIPILTFVLLVSSCGTSDSKNIDTEKLGDEHRNEFGGFSFHTIPGYSLEETNGLVTMTAPGANDESGPAITLVGGIGESEKTIDGLLADVENELGEGSKILRQRNVKIGGLKGLALDIETDSNGMKTYGRMIIAVPQPEQIFTMLGVYPDQNWEKEHGDIFDAVLDSIVFFEPSADTQYAQAEMESSGGVLRQWASSAKASSSYSDPDWSAMQAIGEPEVDECVDDVRAWASLNSDTLEWLELSYDIPVIPTEINIYQSFNPSQVVEVQITDITGETYIAWTGEPKRVDYCPDLMTISIELYEERYFDKVTVFVDQSIMGWGWTEIDAVELVGIPAGSVVSSDQTAAEPVSAPDTAEYTLPTSNPEKSAEYYLTSSEKYKDGRSKNRDSAESGSNIEVSVHPDRIDIRFKGESTAYLLLTLPPDLPDNFSSDLGVFALEGRGPTTAGFYVRSIWYYSKNQGTVKTHFNADGTLSGEVEFVGVREKAGDTADIHLTFDHIPLDE